MEKPTTGQCAENKDYGLFSLKWHVHRISFSCGSGNISVMFGKNILRDGNGWLLENMLGLFHTVTQCLHLHAQDLHKIKTFKVTKWRRNFLSILRSGTIFWLLMISGDGKSVFLQIVACDKSSHTPLCVLTPWIYGQYTLDSVCTNKDRCGYWDERVNTEKEEKDLWINVIKIHCMHV